MWEDEWDVEGKSKWWLRDNDSVLLFIDIYLDFFYYLCVWEDDLDMFMFIWPPVKNMQKWYIIIIINWVFFSTC